MEMPSGKTEKDFYQLCKDAFIKRYHQFGNPDNWKMALDYLKTQSKFKSYKEHMKADAMRVARPTGNKKSKQIVLAKKASDEVLSQVVSSLKKGDNLPTSTLKKNLVYDKAGVAVNTFAQGMAACVEHMSRRNRRVVSSLHPNMGSWVRIAAKCID